VKKEEEKSATFAADFTRLRLVDLLLRTKAKRLSLVVCGRQFTTTSGRRTRLEYY